MTNIRTKEGREELRRKTREHGIRWWRAQVLTALDLLDRQEKGLDIAQEMAEQMTRWRANKPDDYFAALAKWVKWQEGD